MKLPSSLPSVVLACYMVVIKQHIKMVGAQNFCQMMIQTYNVQSQCSNDNSPDAIGTIYADGECRTVETSTSPSSLEYDLLPGNYRAECTGSGQLRFIESGCELDTCDLPFFDDETGLCRRDFNTLASLYARADPAPEFNFEICTTLNNTNTREEVTFEVFGNCSDPGCSVDGVLNPIPPTPRPTQFPTKSPRPTVMPSPAPTKAPVDPAPFPQPAPRPVTPPTPRPFIPPTPAPIDDGQNENFILAVLNIFFGFLTSFFGAFFGIFNSSDSADADTLGDRLLN